jgi:hypothetical protein
VSQHYWADVVRRSGAFRCAHAPYLAIAWLCLGGPAFAQLRDSFETPQATWTLREADCGVRVLAPPSRIYRDAHGGQACENVRLAMGNGTFVYLVHAIGRAPLIQELRPTLYVKADRPSVQLMARVVFPRSIDRGSGQPITSFLRGDMYTDVGQWQQLAIRDANKLLEQEVRGLRTQFGSGLDPREAYIDLIVLNAYSGPGGIDLSIDDLEIAGYVNLDETSGAQAARRPTAADPRGGQSATQPATPPAGATVQGSLLLVRERPLMIRAIQHRGEPLEWLRSLGFNTIKLSSSPSAAELKEARRLGLWLIAPPPYADVPLQPEALDPVIAWSLGARLASRDLGPTNELIHEIRAADPQQDRPLLAGVDGSLAEFSRLANLLLLERPTLGTSQELADLRQWLLARPRLARPGTVALATLETQRSSRLAEQLILFSRGAAWDEDVDPQELRLAAYQAAAAGARGFVFPSEKPLAIDTGPGALRTDAIKLINLELRLLEPWIAKGELAEELATTDGGVQVSVLRTDRSRLMVVTQHAAAQQYVLGPPPQNSVAVMAPSAGASDQAYLVSLAAIKPLKISHTGSGARIVLDDAPHAAAIVLTQDPLAMHHLHRTLAEIRPEATRLRYDVTARRLAATAQIDGQLTQLGHPLAAATAWLREAQATLEQARKLLDTNDFENSLAATAKAEHLLARVRRGHWQQTAAAFPSPAASPCVAQFTTLPLHWAVADRLRQGQWGPNAQAAGDMESLETMLQAGWQQQRQPGETIGTEVSLSLADPHAGRSALRLQAWPADPKRAPQVIERPPVWIASSPIPVRQGQLVQIRGWAKVPRPVTGTSEGLLVFDSLGGPDLGDRIRLTRGWREFTLYRAVPQNGELTVTFALAGLGEAWIDDLSISLLNPEPIRPGR